MFRRPLALLTIPFILAYAPHQASVDAPALELAIEWNLETNFAEGGGHRARFTIHNNGDVALTDANWALHWNMFQRTIDPASITGDVTIEWINGDLYVMKPTEGFQLAPGASTTIRYRGTYALIKVSDAPVGPYVVWRAADGSETTSPVRDFTIAPFEGPDQIHRGPGDMEPIPTAEWLFDQHATITALPDDQIQLIVPQPQALTRLGTSVAIGSGAVIGYEPGLQSEATLLADALDAMLTGSVSVTKAGGAAEPTILLRNSPVDVPGSYTLKAASGDGIVIAGDRSGVFYGTQSLRALIPAEYLGHEQAEIRVPAVDIGDAPAFGYRGMHIDLSRNFNSLATVKRLVDVMAFYKLNKLHINLTDDEGWRIEIAALPELTEYGAFRGYSPGEADYLLPSYGSGPSADPASGYGSGYYTRDQYLDLLRYAAARHIEIIPSVNVPAHSRAAVKAMEVRYARLIAAGHEEEAEAYRLIDPEETSRYRSAQWWTDNVINVCRESAFTFFTTVVDELIAMHDEAGAPLRTFHSGGDEVPLGAWTASPMCSAYMARHPEIDNPKNLQKAFFTRVVEYLAAKDIRTAGWEELAMNFRADGSWTPNDEFADGNAVPYIWNSLEGAEDLGNRLANAGYPVVLANVTNFYFDFAYNKDPRERGHYWGGFVETREAFEFVPYHILRSMRSTADGRPYTDDDFRDSELMAPDARGNILGLQGQLWSETIKGRDILEYYYLPRMLALAERAWHGQADWGDLADRAERNAAMDVAWNTFANALSLREFPRLDRLNGGYNYRLSPPGIIVDDGRITVNTAYPGMIVRYTTDGSEPTAASPRYTAPVAVTGEVITASTFDTRGRASLPTVVDLREE
jgi:hexosaminidase